MEARYRDQFRDFGTLDVTLPAGFTDVSEGYESCPSFESLDLGLRIYVNYADRAMWDRANNEARFSVMRTVDGRTLLLTDDWAAVEAFVAVSGPSNLLRFPGLG